MRTVPPYLLALLIVIALDSFYSNFKLTNYKLFPFFLQNLFREHPFVFMEAWSLSIEEWFYLLIPPVVFVLIRFGITSSKAILITAASVLLCITAYRYYKFVNLPPLTELAWDQGFRKIVVTRLDSIMYGVIAAYIKYYASAWWPKYKIVLLIVGAGLLLMTKIPFAFASAYGCVWYFSLCSLAVMLMLPFMSTWNVAGGVVCRLITRISLISYSVYLLNFSIVSKRLVIPLLNHLSISQDGMMGYLGFWIFTMMLAVLMYKYFEVPVMMFRD